VSTTIEESPATTSRFARGRLAFRHFRWQRPFWAGLFVMIAALPIGYVPYASMSLGDLTIRMATTAGAGSLVISGLLFVLGLTMWFQPHVRIFAGVAAILLALVSLVVSNFGGLVVGFVFGLIGGGMSVAWVPGQPAGTAGPDGGGRDGSGSDVPAAATPGTGSALADFGSAAHQRGNQPAKGRHRAD
jgi:hypothetical protein